MPVKRNKTRNGDGIMKMHKFFATAAFVCLLIAMITGYRKK